MCTLLIAGQTKIVAWTAPDNEEIGAPQNRTTRKKRKTLKAVAPQKSPPKATIVEEIESSPLFSGYRIPVRITVEQESDRLLRNRTKKTIIGGEKVTAPIEFVDLGRGVLEEIGGESWYVGKVGKYYWHDSHGKHGRKPAYKDRALRASGSGKTRAVNVA